MRVWRVEHKTSVSPEGHPIGPYPTREKSETPPAVWAMADALCSAHENGDHPSPWSDSLLKGIASFEACALDSLAALHAWFGGWAERLSSVGFHIAVYEVPQEAARCGDRGQVLFRVSNATLVTTEELT